MTFTGRGHPYKQTLQLLGSKILSFTSGLNFLDVTNITGVSSSIGLSSQIGEDFMNIVCLVQVIIITI